MDRKIDDRINMIYILGVILYLVDKLVNIC